MEPAAFALGVAFGDLHYSLRSPLRHLQPVVANCKYLQASISPLACHLCSALLPHVLALDQPAVDVPRHPDVRQEAVLDNEVQLGGKHAVWTGFA
jgi:hypothetical protein